jgi:hypothetical protein
MSVKQKAKQKNNQKMGDSQKIEIKISLSFSIACTLSLVFFIYLMVGYGHVLNNVNVSNVTEASMVNHDLVTYLDMINWIKSCSIAQFVVVGVVMLGVCIAGCSMLRCFFVDDYDGGLGPGPFIVMAIAGILMVGSYIVQVVYLASAVPIRNTAYDICQSPDRNMDMCNFFNNFYGPLFIILAIIVALNSLNILLYFLTGLLSCFWGRSE